MSAKNPGYILTEIWNAKPAWLALTIDDRNHFFEEKVNPFIGKMVAEGAEFVGCAVNDNDGKERINYRYMAVWILPNKAFSDRLESGARELGFLEYFNQVNFSGTAISPPLMNEDMINLKR